MTAYRRVGFTISPHARAVFGVVIAAAIIPGCGSSNRGTRPKAVTTTGTVTYRSQPVEGARVIFNGDEKTLPAVGLTDADGRFRCTTYDPNDGAVPGDYVVLVTKSVTSGGIDDGPPPDGKPSMERAMLRGMKGGNTPKTMHLVPEKYSATNTSPLKYTVKAGETNDFKIELTD